MNGSVNSFFKGFLTSLLIFFSSFLSSYASTSYQQPVKRLNKNITILDTEKKPINEISAGSQNRELPETPCEESKKEENENETDDDDTNESLNHYLPVHSIENKLIAEEKYFLDNDQLQGEIFIPFYILFHSWKSFLS